MSEIVPNASASTGTNLPERAHFPLHNVVVPVIVGIALSVSTGLGLITIFCALKLYLDKKKTKREVPPFSGTNHLYYEINGLIYETIIEADDELQVKMTNNDAYEDIHFKKTNSHCWCGIDVANKDTIGNTLIQMENNNSYQAITSINSPVVINSEDSASKQPYCYETPLIHTLENAQW